MLRDGPQDLPPGHAPLVLAVLGYIGASALSMSVGRTPEHPVGIIALAVTLPVILVRIVLTLRGHPARWLQTLTALFGTGALLSVLSLPLSLAGSEPPTPVILASLLLFGWSFAVDAHIWRHALEASFAVGLAVAVVLFTVSMFVINSLAGPL